MTRSLSLSSSSCSNAIVVPRGQSSEAEPRLSCCIGQSLDAPVVEIPVTVENDFLDLLLEADFRDQCADLLGLVHLRVVVERPFEVTRERRSGGNRLAVHVVDDLSVDVTRAPENRETRAFRCSRDL